jgi:hypothetical protein
MRAWLAARPRVTIFKVPATPTQGTATTVGDVEGT